MADYSYLTSLGIRVGKYLSKGKYGSVYDCTLYGRNNLVIKIIPNVVWYTKKGKLLISEAQKEIILQKNLSSYKISPDILKSGICRKERIIFIVMEKIVGKTFFNWYNDCKNKDKKDKMITKIKALIQKMNEHHIYHQDMHANNILIDKNNQPFIIDFGMAVFSLDAPDKSIDIDDFEDTLSVEWPEVYAPNVERELEKILDILDRKKIK